MGASPSATPRPDKNPSPWDKSTLYAIPRFRKRRRVKIPQRYELRSGVRPPAPAIRRVHMTPNDPQPVLRVLPRGPHGLSRDQIVASQRARLLAGAIEAVAARGYVGTAVADIIARAGVSRRTFYELYEDRDACVAEAYEVATE